jgi:PhzF family phenazine biosynthesis protein
VLEQPKHLSEVLALRPLCRFQDDKLYYSVAPRKIEVMRIPLFRLNAFTNRPFGGNPAAVCLLDSWLDDGWLRKVAAENNVSATAFLVPTVEHYEIRWFTPACEVKLCGHATLAAGFVVCEILKPGVNHERFSTRFHGIVRVCKDEKFFLLDMPRFMPQVCPSAPASLLAALGGAEPSAVLETNQTYIVVLRNEKAIRNTHPKLTNLEKLHPFAVCITASGESSDFVSRYFAPSYGVPEDPVTGSVHCALAPYWSNRMRKSRLHAKQLSERGGELWCDVSGDRVTVSGNAVLMMSGWLTI